MNKEYIKKHKISKREQVYNIVRTFQYGCTESEVREILKGYRNTGPRLLELTDKYRGKHALIKVEGKKVSPETGMEVNCYIAIDPDKDYFEYIRDDIADYDKVMYCIKKVNDPLIKIKNRKELNIILFDILQAKARMMDYMADVPLGNLTIQINGRGTKVRPVLDKIYKNIKNTVQKLDSEK